MSEKMNAEDKRDEALDAVVAAADVPRRQRGGFPREPRRASLPLDSLATGLEGLEDDATAVVPVGVLRRLVWVARGIRPVVQERRVVQEHPRAMDHALGRAAREVCAQVEVEAVQLPDTHPEMNLGTVRVTAYVLDPMMARHL